jgi:aminopeptidase N
MEHQTATSMGYPWIVNSNINDYVVAHELSHSWVGDMITMRHYAHAWTKEGFATYCEALYFEHLYGVNYYHNYMNGMNVLSYALRRS